ncbi:MAG: hypothetical protein HUK06_08795, partial [Bacteroidaceae bacterium]|nr:hypothetical protein [Bacteroidaceae bacterium]
KKKYPELWTRGAKETSNTDAASANVTSVPTSENGSSAGGASNKVPDISAGKVTENGGNVQGDASENVDAKVKELSEQLRKKTDAYRAMDFDEARANGSCDKLSEEYREYCYQCGQEIGKLIGNKAKFKEWWDADSKAALLSATGTLPFLDGAYEAMNGVQKGGSVYIEQEAVDEYAADPALRIEDKRVTDGALSLIERLRKAGTPRIEDDGASVEESLTTKNYRRSDVDFMQELLNMLHADEANGSVSWRYLGEKSITWFDAATGTYHSVSYENPKSRGQSGKFGYTIIRYKKTGEDGFKGDGITPEQRAEMRARITDWLSKDNLKKAEGKSRDEILEEFGNEPLPIAYVPRRYLSLIGDNLRDARIYCGKGYFIDHALRNHGSDGTQIPVEDVDVNQYLNIQSVLDNPDSVKEKYIDGKRTIIFIKKIGRFYAELTQVEEDGKIILHKSLFNQKKEPYAKLNDIRRSETSSEGGASSISHVSELTPAISLESRGDVSEGTSSAGKVTENAGSVQGKGSENGKIDDWGEKIAGARKDMFATLAQAVGEVTEQSLADNPLSKVWKRPDYAKMVEKGQVTPEDALVLEALTRAVTIIKRPNGSGFRARRDTEVWAKQVKATLDIIKRYAEGSEEERERIRGFVENGTDLEGFEDNTDGKGLARYTSVLYHVMRELGYPNTKPARFSMPELKELDLQDGGKAYYVNGRRFTDRGAAMQEASRVAKVSLGYDNIEYTPEDFTVTPIKGYTTRETGKFAVEWRKSLYRMQFGKKVFDTREEAEAYAARLKLEGKAEPYVRPETETEIVTNGYQVHVYDPATRQRHRTSDEVFATEEEARAYIGSNIAELGEKANRSIAPIHKRSSGVSDADRLRLEPYFNSKTGEWEVRTPVGGNDVVVHSCREYKDAVAWVKDKVNRERAVEWSRRINDAMRNGNRFTPEKPRVGTDWRKGRDVSEKELGETFGFRGIQFGNWTSQNDRQKALNETYDALMDLADVLGVSPRALSLNGELGMAFGARGSGGFAAHYEPSDVVINLTKTRGAGSLAHEWWHAMDNYFGRMGWSSATYLTDLPRGGNGNVRDVVARAFLELVTAVNRSGYNSRNAGSAYWGSNVEETARLFAEWVKARVAEKGNSNSFLAHGILSEEEYKRLIYDAAFGMDLGGKMTFEEFSELPHSLAGYRYPTSREMETLAPFMQNLFDVIEEKVENGKAVLFHKGEIYAPSAGERIVGGYLMEMLQAMGLKVVADKGVGQSVLNKTLSEIWQYLNTPSEEVLALSPRDAAKVRQIREKMSELQKKFAGQTTRRGVLTDLANAFGASGEGVSKYVTLRFDNGSEAVVRFSNHNANADAYAQRGEQSGNISIVFKSGRSGNRFKANDAVELTEYVYTSEEIAKDGNLLPTVARSLIKMLDTGVYEDLSGKAIVNKSPAKILQKMTENGTQFFKTSRGEVYGFVKDGVIYLDPEMLNPNTPIHEYDHLWDNALMQTNPELWARWKDLVRGTEVWNEVLADENYADIRDNEDLVASEVKARLTGARGEARLRALVEETAKKEGVIAAAEKVTLVERIKALLTEMWEKTKEWFAESNVFATAYTKEEIESMTVDDFINKTLRDFADGVNPVAYSRGENTQYRFVGERGARNADKAEGTTVRMDNLKVAEEMEAEYKELQGSEKHRKMVEASKRVKELQPIPVEAHGMSRDEQKAKYVGFDNATNKETGVNVKFFSNSFDKNHRDGGLFEKAVPKLKEAFETAVFAYSEPEKLAGTTRRDGTIHKEHRSVRSYDNYVNKLNIEGKDYYVRYTVQIQPGQNGIHSQFVSNVELYDTENPTKVASYRTSSGPARLDFNEISDAKLKRFFELASETEEEFAKKLKLATGWERGKDGKWRYEETDMMDNVRLADITELSPSVESLGVHVKGSTLGSLLGRDNALFRNYPELADMRVDLAEENIMKGAGGMFTEVNGVPRILIHENVNGSVDILEGHIRLVRGSIKDLENSLPDIGSETWLSNRRFLELDTDADAARREVLSDIDVYREKLAELEEKLAAANEKADKAVRSILLHEVQHAIQRIEGFARGGSVRMFVDDPSLVSPWMENLVRSVDLYNDFRDTMKISLEEYIHALAVDGEFGSWSSDFAHASESRIMESYNTIKRDMEYERENPRRTAYQKYQSVAGEVEARNAQKRMGMTDEQRRQLPAGETEDVPRDEQIVMYRDGVAESRKQSYEDMLDEFFANPEDAKNRYNGTYFFISDLPEILEGCGFGDGIFELPFKSVKSHYGKADHLNNAEDWKKLPEAISNPFAVTRYGKNGYRIYSRIKSSNGKNIVIGIDVKKINQGKNKPIIEINSVKTAFENNGHVSPNDVLVGYDERITPAEEALLNGLNYRAYPTLQELNSATKLGRKVRTDKKSGEKVSVEGDISAEDPASYRIVDDGGARTIATSAEAKRQEAQRLADKLNTRIRVVDDVSTIVHPDRRIQAKRRRSKGWYDTKTGEIVVVVQNNRNVGDVLATVLHEIVGHKGLRELIGEERYGQFLMDIYTHAKADVRKRIDKLAGKNGWNFEKATDEYLAGLAEKGFEDFDEAEKSIWQKLKQKVLDAINKFLKSLKLPKWVKLGDNELRYMLWRSYENLRRGKEDVIQQAQDIVKREELGIGDAARMRMGDAPETFETRQKRAVENKGTVMPGLNDAEVKMLDIPRHPYKGRWSEARAAAIADAVEKYTKQGKNEQGQNTRIPIPQQYDNYGVSFTYNISKNSIEESVNPKQTDKSVKQNASAGVHLAVLNHLDEIIGASIEVEEHPDYLKDEQDNRGPENGYNPNVLVHRFMGAIVVDGVPYRVKTTMLEYKQSNMQNRQYAYDVTKIELLDNEPGSSVGLDKAAFNDVGLYPTANLLRNVEKSYDNGEKLLKNSKKVDEDTAMYRDDGETGDIWNDHSLGFDERMTAAATRLANNHAEDKRLKNDAWRAIGGNLANLRKAMSLQRQFDITTVKRVADLARILMDSGFLTGLNQMEVKRLIAA